MIVSPKYTTEALWRETQNTRFVGVHTAKPGHRFYSPSLGRFINKDPIEEQGGLNLYGFCSNNPINKWDHLGMVEVPDWFHGSEDDYSAYLSANAHNPYQDSDGGINTSGIGEYHSMGDVYAPTISYDRAQFLYGGQGVSINGGGTVIVDSASGQLIGATRGAIGEVYLSNYAVGAIASALLRESVDQIIAASQDSAPALQVASGGVAASSNRLVSVTTDTKAVMLIDAGVAALNSVKGNKSSLSTLEAIDLNVSKINALFGRNVISVGTYTNASDMKGSFGAIGSNSPQLIQVTSHGGGQDFNGAKLLSVPGFTHEAHTIADGGITTRTYQDAMSHQDVRDMIGEVAPGFSGRLDFVHCSVDGTMSWVDSIRNVQTEFGQSPRVITGVRSGRP